MASAAQDELPRYLRNFRDEVDGVALYRALARAEKDERLKGIYERLAKSEEGHLDLWRQKIAEAGGVVPAEKPSMRVRIIGRLAQRFGPGAVAPLVARMEQAAFTMYGQQSDAVAAGLPGDERGHAVISREIAGSGVRPSDIARIEGRHTTGSGNALRAAVLGATDGLVSNLCLVMGVAGADPGRDWVLLSGFVGLLSGAISMGMGEWLSVQSSVEAFERQVEIERDELRLMPAEEAEELALIYEAKGFGAAEARRMADRIIMNPESALDTLTREELGMSAEEVGNPWSAAGASSALFSLGALFPILPWLFTGGTVAVALSAVLGGIFLFGLGAATSLFTGRSALFTGGRELVVGLGLSAVTFVFGLIIGEQIT